MLVCFFLLHGALDYLITRLCFDTLSTELGKPPSLMMSGCRRSGQTIWLQWYWIWLDYLCLLCLSFLMRRACECNGLISTRRQPISGATLVIIPQAYDANGFFAMCSNGWDRALDLYQDGMMRLYSPTHHQTNRFVGGAMGLKKKMKWISDAAQDMQFFGKME